MHKLLRFIMPIGFLAVAAGFAAVVMLLWNWLMPAVFGLCVINFWQALGILLLCRILFGKFGGWHHKRHGWNGWHDLHGKNHLREKWQKMTAEERKEFINKRRKHFAGSDFFDENHFDFGTDKTTPKDSE